MRYWATCMLHQITQHLELFGSEANLLPHLFDTMTIGVKHQRANHDSRIGWSCRYFGTTDCRPQPRSQFPNLKGLGHIVVSACIERLHFVILFVSYRKHNDWNMGVGAVNSA